MKEKNMKTMVEFPKTAKCDLCEGPLRSGPTFYDGRVAMYHSWARVCSTCWGEKGKGIGPGKGREYSSATDQKLSA